MNLQPPEGDPCLPLPTCPPPSPQNWSVVKSWPDVFLKRSTPSDTVQG
jgi:hypothetical protein